MKTLAALLVFFALVSPVVAKDKWLKINSKHFTLIGNASERDIRTVGTKLEQFRSVFSQLFPRVNVESPVPITVIVFKNKSSYVPFMPGYNGKINEVAGYFQSGQDVSYITLTSEFNEQNPFHVIFHEYVHSLTHDSSANVPPWFGEGIAEFYSMFEVSDKDKKVQLGAPIGYHVFHLRDSKFLPLQQLFAVNHDSPEYNERDKKGVFYAESWALIHYLMLGNNGQRRPQLMQFLELVNSSVPVTEAFNRAFQAEYSVLEAELKKYISNTRYPVLTYTSTTKLTFDDEMGAATEISEAESNFHLGDLLAHQRRTDAEKYLQASIQADPTYAPAYASLGLTRTYTGNFNEAITYLEKAVKYDQAGKNHLVYYYYAQALMQKEQGGGNALGVENFDKQKAALIRTNLKRAIELKPSFAHAYSMLSFINLVSGEQIDETVGMLKRAIQLAPGDHNLGFQLAQLYYRQEKYEDAKKTIEPIVRSATDSSMKYQAQSLLESIVRTTEQIAKYKAETEAYEKNRNANPAPASGGDTATSTYIPGRPTLSRRSQGDNVTGLLTKMDCTEKGITLHVTAENKKLVFHTTTPQSLKFVSFAPGIGENITCAAFNPAMPVRIVYRSNTDAKAKFDGEPIAVEFVKPEEK